jgi:hypothetical protein
VCSGSAPRSSAPWPSARTCGFEASPRPGSRRGPGALTAEKAPLWQAGYLGSSLRTRLGAVRWRLRAQVMPTAFPRRSWWAAWPDSSPRCCRPGAARAGCRRGGCGRPRGTQAVGRRVPGLTLRGRGSTLVDERWWPVAPRPAKRTIGA